MNFNFYQHKYKLGFLLITTFLVFSPTLTAEICKVDDSIVLGNLKQIDNWSLLNIFSPGNEHGSYYRPLIMLFYWMDMAMFEFNTVFMHTVNILLHLCNVSLVYLVANQITLLLKQPLKKDWLPFWSALVFAVHPLTTESIAWLSGRTDLLACIGVLSCSWFLLKYRSDRRLRYLVLAGMAFFFGALGKETTLAFLPGAVMLLCVPLHSSVKKLAYWKTNVAVAATGSLLVWCVVLLRQQAFSSDAPRFDRTILFIFNDLPYAAMVCLRAFGFYIKKLFVPWPLNFAIVEVDPIYELAAIPLVLLFLYILSRWTLVSAMFCSGVLMFFPAFLAAFHQVAWTPYAERYLYLSMALIICPLLYYLSELCKHPIEKKVGKIALVALVVLLTVTTIQRTFVWQTNERLLADVARKSPVFVPILVAYGHVLVSDGNYFEAFRQFLQAKKAPTLGYNPVPDIAIANVYFLKGEYERSESLFCEILKQTEGQSLNAVKAYTVVFEQIYSDRSEPQQGVDDAYELLQGLCGEESLPACFGAGIVAFRKGEGIVARDLLEYVIEYTEDKTLISMTEDELKRLPGANHGLD